jgi:hypothetical protein
VESILSRVVFRNVTSEPVPQPRRQPGKPAARRGGQPPSRQQDGAEIEALEASLAAEPSVPPPLSEEMINLTDPKAMRALAHPVRMALLEILTLAGTLTATQASELLGESPANCAFHLRTLAKYGFVHEAGGGKGRERPWVRTASGLNLESVQEDPQASMAAEVLGRTWNERWMERARRYLRADIPGWRGHGGTSQSLLRLTPDELTRLRKEVHDVVSRYDRRKQPEAEVPAEALPVELLFISYPLPDLAALDASPADDAAAAHDADADDAAPDAALDEEEQPGSP